MVDKPRFTLQMTLRDNLTGEQLHHAIDLSEEVRISTRAVGEMKASVSLGVQLVSETEAIRMMQQRVMRKDLFTKAGQVLAAQMAERMEDAEGWHDESRIAPAREALGGRWK